MDHTCFRQSKILSQHLIVGSTYLSKIVGPMIITMEYQYIIPFHYSIIIRRKDSNFKFYSWCRTLLFYYGGRD